MACDDGHSHGVSATVNVIAARKAQGDHVAASPRHCVTCHCVDVAHCAGIPIDQVARLSQSERDAVGRKIFQITLLELFRFRFMQVSSFSPVGFKS